jgi:spoIIIJ-associated protein
MKEKVYQVKGIEEAQQLAVKDLGLPVEDLNFEVSEESNSFMDAPGILTVNVSVDIDPIKKAKDYLEMILSEGNFEGQIEKRVRGNVVEFNIFTDDANGVLIGKNSKTLAALQHITSVIVNQYFDRENETGLIVKVDVGDYRKGREHRLESMAVRIAKEVAQSKVPVTLEYMNSYERKVIHNKLSDWKDVTTHSEGEEPKRFVIIEPRNKKAKSTK